MRRLLAGLVLGVAALVLALVLPGVWIGTTFNGAIHDDPSLVPSAPVAIVFGAGLQADGRPTVMLADRVEAAAELYRAGKVKRLLMTGDNSLRSYDEVTAMKRLAVELGVPADQVNLDYAGFRTYDSCYRAAAIFGVTRAVLVSQRYHLPRALFLAGSFGIEAVGLAAGLDSYPNQSYYNVREFAAQTVSWYEVNVTRPTPRYLGERVDLEQQNQP